MGQAHKLPQEQVDSLDVQKLMGFLLNEWWHSHCTIDTNYVRKHDKNKRSIVVVKYNNPVTGKSGGLRYSHGPMQGYFWDGFGDDMQNLELAILALSKAPPPISAAPWKVTSKEEAIERLEDGVV